MLLKKIFKKVTIVTVEQYELSQALRQAGYRVTQPRLAILRVLAEHDEGLSPEEIHVLGKELCPTLGLVTVYRTLELFREMDLVRRVHSDRRCHAYASGGDDRHHLICQHCHRVIEFPCDGLDDLIARVRRRTGFTVSEHLLELSGLCPECQAAHEK